MTDATLYQTVRFVEYVALGFGTGLYGTLIGAGGGFVLMPILLLLFPEESPGHLTSVSLAVVFFNALGGSEAYAIMRRIDYRSGLMFAAATVPGAVLGALHTEYASRRVFDGIFGILLVAGAAFLFFRAWRGGVPETRHYHYEVSRHLVESSGNAFDYSFNPVVGIGLSFIVGYVSSFLGIGGGIIHVPAMTYFLNFPVHVATATSHFVLSIMAFTGTATHVATGTFPHNANLTLSLAIGALLGAPLGAYLSSKIEGDWIIRGLALALILVGLRILVAAI